MKAKILSICLLSLLFFNPAVRADEGWNSVPGLEVLIPLVLIPELAIVSGGIVCGSVNWYRASNKLEHNTTSLVFGYVTSALNLTVGVLAFRTSFAENSHDRGLFLPIAVMNLAIGSYALGMTIWGNAAEVKGSTAKEISIRPFAVPLEEGNFAAGLSLVVSNW